MTEARRPSVVIVGAGLGGVGTAIELRRHGFDEITVLEKAPGIGATWWYNRYPLCACDVPSHREGGDGRIVANWPGYMRDYERAAARLDPHEFEFVPAPVREAVGA